MRRRSQGRPRDPLAMTVQAVAEGREPVLLVIHEDDRQAGWAYLPGRDYESAELLLTHASHLVDDDPSLRETSSLKSGTYASRETVEHPWVTGDVKDLRAGEESRLRAVLSWIGLRVLGRRG